ncbi:MAG: hypothetical protein N2449_02845 [Bacteroidales bacterium]|nr:hypothetical protein [Bacteroidales bacterium]
MRSYSPVSDSLNKWVSRSEFSPKELKRWEQLFKNKNYASNKS